MTSQSLKVELYYNGVWNDLTAANDVFIAPIVIKRGQSDEATQLRPASISMQLANDDDKYRTSNPVSPLYGKAGLNTPTRVSVAGTVRGVVEASSWAADQTRDFRASPPRGKAWVDVEGGGLLQRIGQWTQVIESTMVKGMRSFGGDLVGAWPLEDDSTSTILSNLVAGGAAGQFSDVTLGDSERPAGSARSVKFGTTGHIVGTCLSSTASGWQMSFAFKLPALPGSATAEEIFTWYDSTGRRWTWEVNNANYGWNVYAPDGTVLATGASPYTGGEPNQWIRAKMKVTVSGSTITYEPSWYAEGAASDVGVSGTFSGTSTGYLTRWGATAATYNVGAWYTGVFGIDNASVPLFNAGVIADFNGHVGETAGDRFARLMGDLGLSYTVLGSRALSAEMGGQPEATAADLLQEIINTDDALLFDDIDSIGLVLMLRNARYNQTPALALTVADLPGLPVEVTDNLGVYNVVTASQTDGGSVTAEDSTSRRGSQPPPNGVGEIRRTVDVNVADEANDLPRQANWWLRRGTVDLPRFPEVTVDLGALDASKVAQVDAVDIGEVITITGMREYVIRLIVIGYVETIRVADQGKVRRRIVFTCVPDQQFVTGEYNDGVARYDSDTTTLKTTVNSSATSLTFRTVNQREVWSSTSTPYGVLISGEQVTVTSMGAASLVSGAYDQVATVTRSVNGIVKSLATGEPIHIATPGRWAL